MDCAYKNLGYLLIFLLFIPSTSAMYFYQDTNITQGGITYTFSKGLNLTSMEVLNNAIRLNGDVYKFVPQGGNLHITWIEFDGLSSHKFSMESNVEQTIGLGVLDYYFFDGTTYHRNEYLLSEKVNGQFMRLTNQEKIVTTTLERKSWIRKSFVEYEYRTTMREGIVYGEVFVVDNLTALLFAFIILIVGVFSRRL